MIVCPLPPNYSSLLNTSSIWRFPTTKGVPLPLPTSQRKSNKKQDPQKTSKKTNNNKKQTQKQRPREKKEKKKKKKKKKKERKKGAIFANPPSEDPLVDEPSYGKRFVRRGLQQQYLMRFRI